jgi:hypothetical protein
VSVLRNTTPTGGTTLSFAPQQPFATGSNPFSVAVADFNGDGKQDLAVTNEGDHTVSVLLNMTPTGGTTLSFAPQQPFATGPGAGRVAVGDFNGDGKPDLAVVNYSSNTVSVLLNTTPTGGTTPSFAPQQTFDSGISGSQSMAVGDFNGDGKPDLAFANGGATVSVLVNTTPAGATSLSFAPQQTFATGINSLSVAVGDFNGDGKPDLAFVHSVFEGTVSVLLNDTQITLSGSPATGTISSALEAPTAIAVAAGNNQSATVNTAFAAPLAVDVRNAAGHLVQNVSVTFTAPGSGPGGRFGSSTSATVVTNASGRATAPPFVADTTAGGFQVTAQAAGGSNPSTNFSLTNTPAAASGLTRSGLPASLVAGTPVPSPSPSATRTTTSPPATPAPSPSPAPTATPRSRPPTPSRPATRACIPSRGSSCGLRESASSSPTTPPMTPSTCRPPSRRACRSASR